MTLYIGVDFHPHQQTVAWCDRQTGEARTLDLAHDLERVREFYSVVKEPKMSFAAKRPQGVVLP